MIMFGRIAQMCGSRAREGGYSVSIGTRIGKGGKYLSFITARICFAVISLDLIKPGMAASGPVNVPTLQ